MGNTKAGYRVVSRERGIKGEVEKSDISLANELISSKMSLFFVFFFMCVAGVFLKFGGKEIKLQNCRTLQHSEDSSVAVLHSHVNL